MKKALYAVVLVAMMIAGDKVVAQEKKALEKQPDTPETYVAPMGTQFVRGIVNMATGWGEFPRQIVLSAKDDILMSQNAPEAFMHGQGHDLQPGVVEDAAKQGNLKMLAV